MAELERATCRFCNAGMEFVLTAKGRKLPLELGSADDGNVIIHPEGPPEVCRDAQEATAVRLRYGLPPEAQRISHFARCPEADKARGSRR